MKKSGGRDLGEMASVASSIVVMVAALVMVGVYLYDRSRPPVNASARYIEDWEEWRDIGIRIGADDASMVVSGFMDFTCPFCAGLAPVIDSVLLAYPDDMAFDFLHYPLAYHEYAMPSAIAAECADRQGRFHNMFQALYSERDSIGVKSWDRFAHDAGIPDLKRFMQCVDEPEASFDRIAAGRALGKDIEITGTPSVFVNGRTFNARDVSDFIKKAEELGLPDGG